MLALADTCRTARLRTGHVFRAAGRVAANGLLMPAKVMAILKGRLGLKCRLDVRSSNNKILVALALNWLYTRKWDQ